MRKKKLQHEMDIDLESSATSIENLSNEIFHEIFDYLDGINIYKSFFYLNSRFQQLLNSSSLVFKIQLRDKTLDEIFIENYQQIILHHKHQILSIELWLSSLDKHFFVSFPIDSSFNHLECIAIENLPSNIVIPFLTNLIHLPRLFSLKIEIWKEVENLNDIYRLIFSFPSLKYNKFVLSNDERLTTLPIATNQQLSPIKHLVLIHACNFHELSTLLSYTLELERLTFMDTHDGNMGTVLPITLSKLVYLRMDILSVTFDEFEIFIEQMKSKLKVLHVIIQSDDFDYLDADRWEQLITKYLPELEKFYLDFHNHGGNDPNQPPLYSRETNRFFSSFWIKRQWIFESQLQWSFIVYFVRPYQKRWYEINSTVQSNEIAQLDLEFDLSSSKDFKSTIEDINEILIITEIYHLKISTKAIPIDIFIETMYLLPELLTFKIHSLLLSKLPSFEKFFWISQRNKITKVCFEKINDIEEIYFLMKLCPSMNYLQVNSISDINVELLVNGILTNDFNLNLPLLCFRVPTINDKMIRRLKKMIDDKKLLVDCEVKLVAGMIYLQWQ